MIQSSISIDKLIDIVRQGGRVKTGVDVYDSNGTLLLAKDVLVDKTKPLKFLRNNGLRKVPVASNGGVFDASGNKINIGSDNIPEPSPRDFSDPKPAKTQNVTERLKQIQELRRFAESMSSKAQACIKNAVNQIRHTEGEFNVDDVSEQASELASFAEQKHHPLAYAPRELFFYDDYFYSHAANVCALGSQVLHRFNTAFSNAVEKSLWSSPAQAKNKSAGMFSYYYPEEVDEMCFGLFIYDLGKSMVPEEILNKPSVLTEDETHLIQKHTNDFGFTIIEKNHLGSTVLSNMIRYHHGPIYEGEPGCYPFGLECRMMPPYVRICKLMDIYDAMISKRSYQDAINQVTAVTSLFRNYVHKDPLLQYILHAFVKTIGLYPPGSIVFLKNGQMAYVLESEGPLVLPFTNSSQAPLTSRPDPYNAGEQTGVLAIDSTRSIRHPKTVWDCLPAFIREVALPEEQVAAAVAAVSFI
ncbi:HD domain-containing phosphohydrolase [uncultured Desulfobacter sp.]|uniref:HD-GYP domain-containing protein n=1 Tax=uncultured Desulfobacter sp. TaxID=240139 RepID=UPI002AAB54C9|nr:HD domain-containing phosphohydrolase [uncultured Desulfobacter sp.]